ncbi:MAG TPA: nitrate reductase associated protein [Candidatus Binatia bacterium]|nr:nitrate reductase associated protein [Candidatus Binatia bacterium]
MFHRFRYEAEFYPTLNRIPLDVRRKLDLSGLKISLKDWLAYSFEERTALCHLPVDSVEEKQAFTAYLHFLSRKNNATSFGTSEPLDPESWSTAKIPAPVAQKSAACFNAVMLAEWRRWESHQRYALYKTAISKSQPEAFADVLAELRAAKKSSDGS